MRNRAERPRVEVERRVRRPIDSRGMMNPVGVAGLDAFSGGAR